MWPSPLPFNLSQAALPCPQASPVLNVVVPLRLGLLEPLIRERLELLQQLLLPRTQQLVVLHVHKPLDEFLPRPT